MKKTVVIVVILIIVAVAFYMFKDKIFKKKEEEGATDEPQTRQMGEPSGAETPLAPRDFEEVVIPENNTPPPSIKERAKPLSPSDFEKTRTQGTLTGIKTSLLKPPFMASPSTKKQGGLRSVVSQLRPPVMGSRPGKVGFNLRIKRR